MSRSEKNAAGKSNSRGTMRADSGPALQCLVVSSDSDHQQLVSRAVTSAGWEPIVCSDSVQASAAARVRLMQLAIVVLEGERGGEFDSLLEKLSQTKDMLLVVCGNQNAIEEEVFVRQLGAWFYLPGLADAAAVTNLCEEARRIAERAVRQLAESVAPSSMPKGSVPQPRSTVSRARSRRVQ